MAAKIIRAVGPVLRYKTRVNAISGGDNDLCIWINSDSGEICIACHMHRAIGCSKY